MSASQYRPLTSLRSSTEPYEYFGCGWHESSYELACGAQAEEGLSLEEFELWVMVAEQRAVEAKGLALEAQAQARVQP